MKLIINIPEVPLYRDMYMAICENGYIFDEDNEYIAKAIKNGTPIPDNATNGNVFKEIFSDITRTGTILTDEIENLIATNVNVNWWNAPIRKAVRNE